MQRAVTFAETTFGNTFTFVTFCTTKRRAHQYMRYSVPEQKHLVDMLIHPALSYMKVSALSRVVGPSGSLSFIKDCTEHLPSRHTSNTAVLLKANCNFLTDMTLQKTKDKLKYCDIASTRKKA